VYVVLEAATPYVAECFRQYGVVTDESGRYAALYRPLHLIGLELGISVASVALRREATGAARGFHADVVSVAKRDLRAGEVLDGEGGHRVWGRLAAAAESVAGEALPIGLAHGARLTADVAAGSVVRRSEVSLDEASEPVRLRRLLEETVRGPRAERS
jgi:predicted homoserine dehydrogenase-like protein